MSNITANARKLLIQQQQPVSTTRFEISDLFRNVYDNIPDETKRFLELSLDFIHLGSPILANAYISKCLEYMESAKGALVQNMSSVAGSMVGSDSRADVVQPWINRNSTFMNRTGVPSQLGSTVSAFKQPLPVRSVPSSRKQLRPISENTSYAAQGLPPPPSQTFRRPANPYQVASDDEAPPRTAGHVRSTSARMIRSTPIRPDVRRRPGGAYENDENMFESISPLRAQKPTRPKPPAQEGEDDLLTKNSPSTRSNSKKRGEAVVKRKAMQPPAEQNTKKRGRPAHGDTLNSTITKHGRVVKPPRKYASSQDNSILRDVEEFAKPMSRTKADTTVSKKRKLLPTVEDDIETSVRQAKVRQPKPSSSSSRDTSATQEPTSKCVTAVAKSTSKCVTAVAKTTSVPKRAPTTQHKQPKPAKPSKAPPSPIPQANKKPKSIKLSTGGTPQLDFDISQRSFRSCESDSDASDL